MITEERWKKAQSAEAVNWASSGHNSWRLLYELTEHSSVAEHLETFLEGKTGLTAIEVGIGPLGTGFLSVHAAPHFSKIVGIEPLSILRVELKDKALEKYARELQSRVEVVPAKGEKLPFEDESFDIACCINVIDHAHYPDDILAEIGRVIKLWGIFVFGVNTLSLLGRIKWRLLRLLRPKDLLFVAHPYIYGWGKVCKKFQAGSWSTLWENRPSILKRVAGHGRMSFWILERVK